MSPTRFFAVLFAGGGVGMWHTVEYYEKEKINESSDIELFVKSWEQVLEANVEFKYDWSYIVSVVGVGCTLASAVLFMLSAVCIKNDRAREEAMNMQYLMPGETKLWHGSTNRSPCSVSSKATALRALRLRRLPRPLLRRISIWLAIQPVLKGERGLCRLTRPVPL